MTELLIAVLGSSTLSTAITCIFTAVSNRRKKKDGTRKGVQQLMYNEIKTLCKQHIARGYITSNDLEDLERMHKIYHDDLDGNGYLDDLMSKVRKLKIVPVLPED